MYEIIDNCPYCGRSGHYSLTVEVGRCRVCGNEGCYSYNGDGSYEGCLCGTNVNTQAVIGCKECDSGNIEKTATLRNTSYNY